MINSRILHGLSREGWYRLSDAVTSRLMVRVAQLRWLRRAARRPHWLPGRLVVSLTSYPARFPRLPLTLKCLLSQTVRADRVILWIAHGDKASLTPQIWALEKEGLEISFCEDLRSFKKVVPLLAEEPDAFIVTADDDLYYWPTWLEELVASYAGNPLEVLSHRVHRIRLDEAGLPLPYHRWEGETTRSHASILNFHTGGSGALYPPKSLHPDVLKVEVFRDLCPLADDVWLYWMMRLNGAVARKIGPQRRLVSWPKTQGTALCLTNVAESGNDQQIRAMVHRYGFPGGSHIDTEDVRSSKG